MNSQVIEPYKVKSVIEKINVSKYSGPDNKHPKLLNYLARCI